jgi:hypothetical protein
MFFLDIFLFLLFTLKTATVCHGGHARTGLEEIGKRRLVIEEEHFRYFAHIVGGRAKQFAYLII